MFKLNLKLLDFITFSLINCILKYICITFGISIKYLTLSYFLPSFNQENLWNTKTIQTTNLVNMAVASSSVELGANES